MLSLGQLSPKLILYYNFNGYPFIQINQLNIGFMVNPIYLCFFNELQKRVERGISRLQHLRRSQRIAK